MSRSQARLKKAEELLQASIAMRDDLIQRAKFGFPDTQPVVACGNTVWMKFQDAIHAYIADGVSGS